MNQAAGKPRTGRKVAAAYTPLTAQEAWGSAEDRKNLLRTPAQKTDVRPLGLSCTDHMSHRLCVTNGYVHVMPYHTKMPADKLAGMLPKAFDMFLKRNWHCVCGIRCCAWRLQYHMLFTSAWVCTVGDRSAYACMNTGSAARGGEGVPEVRVSSTYEVEGDDEGLHKEAVPISIHPVHQLLLHQSGWRPQLYMLP